MPTLSGQAHAFRRLLQRLPPWRVTVAGLIIVLACSGILIARFAEDSPVFAPLPGGITAHEIHVTVDGEPLKADSIRKRYRLPVRGTTSLTPAGLRSIVRNRESRHTDAGTTTFVRLHLRRNAGAETIWLWPDQ